MGMLAHPARPVGRVHLGADQLVPAQRVAQHKPTIDHNGKDGAPDEQQRDDADVLEVVHGGQQAQRKDDAHEQEELQRPALADPAAPPGELHDGVQHIADDHDVGDASPDLLQRHHPGGEQLA